MGSHAANIVAQVCGVSKPLYSVAQAVKAGYDVKFSADGSGMKHRRTGKTFPFILRNGMYELTMQLGPGLPGRERAHE